MGNSPSCADIMFMSCLQVATLFNIEIKSNKIVSYFERAIQRQQYINAMIETFGQEDTPKK